MEINGDVMRHQVRKLVRELMEGERGNEMKKKAMEWKTKAYEAASPGGSSCRNFENLLADILLVQKTEIHLRKIKTLEASTGGLDSGEEKRCVLSSFFCLVHSSFLIS